MLLPLERGQRIEREEILRKLVEIQYERNDHDFGRGTFRVRGDVIEVYPVVRRAGAAHRAVRRRGRRAGVVRSADRQDAAQARQDRGLPEVALRGAARADAGAPSRRSRKSSAWRRGDARVGRAAARGAAAAPAHDVRPRDDSARSATATASRTTRGTSPAAQPGEPPPTLLDYLPNDSLLIVDESHQTVPQVRGMYFGDRSRKEVLVAYGFRLPSALDNRPLNFEEWEAARPAGRLRLRDAGPVRARQIAGRRRRADHPADRPDRSADRRPPGERAGGRPARRRSARAWRAASACW